MQTSAPISLDEINNLLDSLDEATVRATRKRIIKPRERLKRRKYYRRNRAKIKKAGRKFRRSARGRRYNRVKKALGGRFKGRKRIRRSYKF